MIGLWLQNVGLIINPNSPADFESQGQMSRNYILSILTNQNEVIIEKIFIDVIYDPRGSVVWKLAIHLVAVILFQRDAFPIPKLYAIIKSFNLPLHRNPSQR
ncbi:hypothetical protein BN874_1770002 [Candidatus Contendobacter odensis Run_B_J11]|uniref:Uncharacterized protein n=1 Tax=Candidatus Contendobacter odensis Run_B_J11 TaxID=1400861 RepID=A0A7U7J3R9_9GAMM|nr:hypothetical protein BN874_1770002 [Candidatus Contendobacter odensis Run_B_J11]